MKKVIVSLLTMFFATVLSAQVPNGTYVPKNEVAKSLQYEKFVFNGGKVKAYMGVNGISLGVSYEYNYSLSGNTLSIKEGAGSVDFTYDKAKDEISLLAGLYGTEGAVWWKGGKSSSTEPVSKNCIEKLATPQKTKDISLITSSDYFNIASFSWSSVPNTQYYIVNWKYGDREGSFTTYETSTQMKLPNIEGTLFVDVYACGSFCKKWVQSDVPVKFSRTNVYPPPRPGPSPDLYTPEKEVNIDDLQNLFDNISQGFDIMTTFSNGGSIKLYFDNYHKTVEVVEASDDILKMLGLTKGNATMSSKEFFYNLKWNSSFKTCFDLQKLSTTLKWINFGIKVIDISIYWSKTHDWSGAMAWGACEGIKWGTSIALVKIGAAAGTIIAPGVGTAVGGFVGGFAGMIYGMTIDCKDTFTKVDNPNSDEGVIINGVKWATRNIDAPGTFAAMPENAGMFYQWNRKKAWNSIDKNVSGWDSSDQSDSQWTASNDPSPTGWRVPTAVEIESLLNTTKVTCEWKSQNGINGRKFTDKTTGASIFIPAAGWRGGGDGVLWGVGENGSYWSSTRTDKNGKTVNGWKPGLRVYNLRFVNDVAHLYNELPSYGFPVRPVAEYK